MPFITTALQAGILLPLRQEVSIGAQFSAELEIWCHPRRQ